MLQLSAISQQALDLLNSVSRLPFSEGFYLAGGTGLALQYGHRLSVDLDFFTSAEFDPEEIIDRLRKYYPFTILSQSKNSLTLDLAGVKTDFIRHAYPLLHPLHQIDGKRLASVEDIAAMKLNAVKNRGYKKYFFDIYELLRHFTIRELIRFHLEKYDNSSSMIVQKSLLYFEDAEIEPDPVSLTSVTWPEVKSGLITAVKMLEGWVVVGPSTSVAPSLSRGSGQVVSSR